MSQSLKLSKSERQQIIFDFLKNKPNPLYTVEETKYGKYIVKPKQIEIEEETINEEPDDEPQPMKPINDRQQMKRERRKRNRRAKQDAKRILDALTNLINSNNNDESSDDEDEDKPRAPPIIEQPNLNPGPITIKRRRLAF